MPITPFHLGPALPVKAACGHRFSRTVFAFSQVLIYVVHDAAALRREPALPEARIVVAGHSHRPSVAERDGVLSVNPGSAGPRRFRLPIAVAELEIAGAAVRARIVELAIGRGG